MRHLTDDEFVDLIEDAAPAAAGATPARRGRATPAARRRTRSAPCWRRRASDEVPEPSPLFWDHFSARVSEAVRDESPAPAPPAWVQRFRSPLAAWAAAAAMAVLIMIDGRLARHAARAHEGAAAARPARQAPTAAPSIASADAGDNIDADEAWAVVRAAADDLAWEDAHAAGLSAHPGAPKGSRSS